jgi:arylsulfatase A-like enzyme
MFTGLMPRAAGAARVPAPSAAAAALERHRDRVLPEVLRRAGYSTGGLSANVWVSQGFDRGFDEFAAVDSGRVAKLADERLGERLKWSIEAARGRVDDGAAQVERIFAEWLARPPRQPFFWFVNLIECHSPYLPPRPYGDVSVMDRLRAAEDARRYYTLDAIWKACVGGYEVPDATIERMRRLYAGSVRYMDDWLGRVLERLGAAGVLEDTLVIVTADHGENFGEGGFLTHAHSLDNRLIHVPFVVSGPSAGDRSITSLAELPRFIAESAGLDEHPWTDGPAPGIGVAQFDPPSERGDERVARILEHWGMGDEVGERFTMPLTAAVRGNLKVVLRGAEEVVYDLGEDPLELTPLRREEASARGLDASLAPLRAALEHPSMSAMDVPAAEAPSKDELREIEDRMKLLGYM